MFFPPPTLDLLLVPTIWDLANKAYLNVFFKAGMIGAMNGNPYEYDRHRATI